MRLVIDVVLVNSVSDDLPVDYWFSFIRLSGRDSNWLVIGDFNRMKLKLNLRFTSFGYFWLFCLLLNSLDDTDIDVILHWLIDWLIDVSVDLLDLLIDFECRLELFSKLVTETGFGCLISSDELLNSFSNEHFDYDDAMIWFWLIGWWLVFDN